MPHQVRNRTNNLLGFVLKGLVIRYLPDSAVVFKSDPGGRGGELLVQCPGPSEGLGESGSPGYRSGKNVSFFHARHRQTTALAGALQDLAEEDPFGGVDQGVRGQDSAEFR